MAVDADISRAFIASELQDVEVLAKTYEWKIDVDLQNLRFSVRMKAHNDDEFLLDIQCDDYKEVPPLLEFVDLTTGERGTPHAYPKGNDSFFHGAPCICAPFNRKAYKNFFERGPHGDWQTEGWMQSKANNIDWSNYNTLGGMLALIQTRLRRTESYIGRLG